MSAEPPESVREVHLPTLHGTVPRLPGQVTLVYADGSTALSPVAWPALTETRWLRAAPASGSPGSAT
ncbi:Ig-like domain-containing protein [Streptomyces sp. NPDC050121]|uniref:Ig-like domain-containing protein n=1 Tax=Streptomyces sp. NPDC050121 TaxID=3365601 RepID=UPI003787E8FA